MELATSTETLSPRVGLASLIDLHLQDRDLVGCLETVIRDLDNPVPTAADNSSSPPCSSSPVGGVQQLFEALKAKDERTAAHSLRTTLGCAIWAERLKLGAEERDAIEAAALLHDIGKLVAPRRVLRKPGPLNPEEKKLLDLCRHVGFEVVRQKVALPSVLEIATFAPSWYDGSRNWNGLSKVDLPFGSRMLAIIDALDAMVTEQLYRPALSFEQAFAELKRFAGRQFDPQLVQHLTSLPHSVLRQWRELTHREDASDSRPVRGLLLPSGPAHEPTRAAQGDTELFQQHVLEHLRDGVIFVDRDLRITYWNRGATRITGISPEQACQSRWSPALIAMRDGRGVRVGSAECPVVYAISSGKQWFRRVLVCNATGDRTAVDAQVIPVTSSDGVIHGATILMRDLSPEISLRERCVSLQQLITRDGLTQVANRAEFDRFHAQSMHSHAQRDAPYSLIMADIDHFKQINDNFGHQAGDEVLKFFARLLEGACRAGDLVGRYGGEEFAVVCPGCDLTIATQRAEFIRREFANTQHEALGGRQVTASFGVTSLQPGDTPAKMISRADKALYQAKDGGRNAVVAIGHSPSGGRHRASDGAGPPLVEQEMLSHAPLPIAVEKLRGFVADHGAEIVSVEESQLRIKIDAASIRRSRRFTDRRLECYLDVQMEPADADGIGNGRGVPKNKSRTLLKVAIGPLRTRDRRRSNAIGLARELLACFRSYMMVTPDDVDTRG
jgi:diguanylate cyclase (GGDEF)-like protein/PAS domain S-box-containing protein